MAKQESSWISHSPGKPVRPAENAAEAEAQKSAPDGAEVVAGSQAERTRLDKPSGATFSPSSQEGTLKDQTHCAEGTEPDTAACPRQDSANADIEEAAAASKASVGHTPTLIDPQGVRGFFRTSKNQLIQAILNYKPPPEPEVKLEEMEKHLGKALATLLTEVSRGPAAAAACLENPENVRSAVLLWRVEAMVRVGERGRGRPPGLGRPGIPPPCFTWLTRALTDWARRRGLQVSGMRAFWENTTVNVADPPETHQYCSLDYCGLDPHGRWKLWQTAAADTDQLEYAARADSKTDSLRKTGSVLPENSEVLKLAKKIKRDLPKGGTKVEIARDFANGDEKKAQNLLRQLRRYPVLLE